MRRTRRRATSRTSASPTPTATLDHDAILARLRKLALALPDTSETTSFGHPTFHVAKKTFCVFEMYRGELCIVFKAEPPVQHALVQGPRFFVAPYIGKHGWTSLRCALGLDWGEIGDLLRESHRLVAPKARASKATATPSKRASRAKKPARRRSS